MGIPSFGLLVVCVPLTFRGVGPGPRLLSKENLDGDLDFELLILHSPILCTFEQIL